MVVAVVFARPLKSLQVSFGLLFDFVDKFRCVSNLIKFLFSSLLFTAFQTPRIVEHPVDTTVPRNDPVTLYCKAEGIPNPTIVWYKDGVVLKSSQHRNILPMGSLFFLKVSSARILKGMEVIERFLRID